MAGINLENKESTEERTIRVACESARAYHKFITAVDDNDFEKACVYAMWAFARQHDTGIALPEEIRDEIKGNESDKP